jgi:glycogen debranching enzyme
MGMKRYGFSQEAAKVCRAICDAASYFMSGRPPELFAGVSRDQIAFPLRYLGSNVPQAWATGSILAMVQTFIGLRPDGPHNRLLLDPVLPDWLTKLDLRELRVGQQRIDLSLWREGELTRCEVRNAGNLSVEIDSVARPESPNPRCS